MTMMLSTLTSRKDTKTAYRRQFLGVILGICLITASSCSVQEEPEPVPESTPEVTETIPAEDYRIFAGKKVHLGMGTVLWTADAGGNMLQAGTLTQDYEADIRQDASGKYLALADSSFYADGAEMTDSLRWMQHRCELTPNGHKVTTDGTYHLQERDGREIALITHTDTYDVYAEPCADDPRYGIRFNGQLAYIPEAEIASVSGEVRKQGAEKLPVLMYHFFYSEADGGMRKDTNHVEAGELDEQLDWLEQNGYTTLSMEEVLCFMQGRSNIPEKSVVITIDDGDPTVHQYAYPVIREHNMHAVLFLITGWAGQSPQNYDFWEMREDGLELQSHGFLTHQGGCPGMGHGGRLLCMDHDEGVADTRMSFDTADGGFVYCYPFGDYNENARGILRDAGTEMAFTTDSGMIRPGMDLLALPRIRVTGGAGLQRFIQSIGQ